MRGTQGPTATMTWSTPMDPWSVSTEVTALELAPKPKPVTSTPVRMRAPAPVALSASPRIDALLCAYPPLFSCRTEVMPGACQSPNSFRMYVLHAASPSMNSDS